MIEEKLKNIYARLFDSFGPQHWWPGDTPFEVAVGAVLTQNTNWGNVEKAIANLKNANALCPVAMDRMSEPRLAKLIRPSGYYNVKTARLKALISFLIRDYQGNIQRMKKGKPQELRKKLLGINGIGQETADSILLYAVGVPYFVVDAYTKRMFSRHGILSADSEYEEIQELFHRNLARDAGLYNEYHALIVKTGKTFCRPRDPLCGDCPLSEKGLPI